MNWLDAINELKLPPLVSGKHSGGPEEGLCAMEMVAFMERLEHTDRPECTCPILRDFVIAVNDTLNNQERQKLLPVLPELVDTVTDHQHMRHRERFIMDAAARSVEHATRQHHRSEYDYERDRLRRSASYGYDSRAREEIHRMLGHGPKGAVKLLAEVNAPHHLADILIGILRDAIRIGGRRPKTQFNDPKRVKKLAKVEYVAPMKVFEEKMQKNLNTSVFYSMPTIKPEKLFKSFDVA